MNEFVYEYWNRTELGRKMVASDSVSDSDLLFLIPNNVKRRHGLPTTRICGKRKSIEKRNRKRIIMLFQLFDMISDTIEEMIPEVCNEEVFETFVDIRNIDFSDKC